MRPRCAVGAENVAFAVARELAALLRFFSVTLLHERREEALQGLRGVREHLPSVSSAAKRCPGSFAALNAAQVGAVVSKAALPSSTPAW